KELVVRLVAATGETQRHAEPDRQLHRDVALRGLAARLFERGLDQGQGGRGVAAIDLDLGHELAGQLGLATRADAGRELEALPEVLVGAVELAPAAREHAERQERAGLAARVRQLPRNAERLAEVLVREIPLPEAEADEPQVLVVAAHAGEEALPLV